jgi:hypothetical protein
VKESLLAAHAVHQTQNLVRQPYALSVRRRITWIRESHGHQTVRSAHVRDRVLAPRRTTSTSRAQRSGWKMLVDYLVKLEWLYWVDSNSGDHRKTAFGSRRV